MTDKRRRSLAIVFLILTAIIAVFIFANSLQSGEVSDSMSDPIIEKVADSISGNDSSDYNLFKYIKQVVRKSAHFSEFALLGLSFFTALTLLSGKRASNLLSTAFLGLVCAVCDEYIQVFSVGRCSRVTDVLVDFAGVIFGILVARFIIFIASEIERRKSEKK